MFHLIETRINGHSVKRDSNDNRCFALVCVSCLCILNRSAPSSSKTDEFTLLCIEQTNGKHVTHIRYLQTHSATAKRNTP